MGSVWPCEGTDRFDKSLTVSSLSYKSDEHYYIYRSISPTAQRMHSIFNWETNDFLPTSKGMILKILLLLFTRIFNHLVFAEHAV